MAGRMQWDLHHGLLACGAAQLLLLAGVAGLDARVATVPFLWLLGGASLAYVAALLLLARGAHGTRRQLAACLLIAVAGRVVLAGPRRSRPTTSTAICGTDGCSGTATTRTPRRRPTPRWKRCTRRIRGGSTRRAPSCPPSTRPARSSSCAPSRASTNRWRQSSRRWWPATCWSCCCCGAGWRHPAAVRGGCSRMRGIRCPPWRAPRRGTSICWERCWYWRRRRRSRPGARSLPHWRSRRRSA